MTKDTTTSAVEQNNDTKPADNENVANQPAVQGNDTPTDNVPYGRFNEVNKQLRDISQLNELLNKKNKKIRIIIGEPVSRNQLPEDDGDAIKELKKLSDSLK